MPAARHTPPTSASTTAPNRKPLIAFITTSNQLRGTVVRRASLHSLALGPHPQRELTLMPRLGSACPRLGIVPQALLSRVASSLPDLWALRPRDRQISGSLCIPSEDHLPFSQSQTAGDDADFAAF